jgi:gamma-glutamyltranspeptidase / glutathione hydrolase
VRVGEADRHTPRVISAVAAGHPATADAGAEILAAGGSAADAAVGAALASCVAETLMTGLLGGGHAIHWDAAAGAARNLDCFVAVPGLGAERRAAEVVALDVPFGAELLHYSVGPATCGVPGVPAGLDELWRAHGRLPWPRLVEPALRIARAGAELPPAHAACLAMLEPVMRMNEGARIYAPGGRLLAAGARVKLPGLVRALELVAEEGAATFYRGTIASVLLELCAERGGLVTADDLAAYEVRWSAPADCTYLGGRVATRAGLSEIPAALGRLPRLGSLTAGERVVALVDALTFKRGDASAHTTNVVAVDADGNACVVTTSLGLGSGDWLPGLDLHLNSMLGEADLIRGRLVPGERMESMMAPTLALDGGGRLAFAGGAAGGTRIRTALIGVLAGVLDEGLAPADAVARPRFHPAGAAINAEPGVDEEGLAELERRDWRVRRWDAPHHYFGGVSVVARTGAAGDPRRSGAARVLG